MIHNICTKIQNPMCNSSFEIFDTDFPMYYIGLRDGKKEKEGNINLSSFVFCLTLYLATLNMQHNVKTLALIEAKKFVTENLLGKKNGQIKGMISTYMP